MYISCMVDSRASPARFEALVALQLFIGVLPLSWAVVFQCPKVVYNPFDYHWVQDRLLLFFPFTGLNVGE